jgi:hypothetical protein
MGPRVARGWILTPHGGLSGVRVSFSQRPVTRGVVLLLAVAPGPQGCQAPSL